MYSARQYSGNACRIKWLSKSGVDAFKARDRVEHAALQPANNLLPTSTTACVTLYDNSTGKLRKRKVL